MPFGKVERVGNEIHFPPVRTLPTVAHRVAVIIVFHNSDTHLIVFAENRCAVVKCKIVVSVTAIFIFFTVPSTVYFGGITETHVVGCSYSRNSVFSAFGNGFADLLFFFRVVITEIHRFEFATRQFPYIIRI